MEKWLPVPGWEGLYEVSDAGRVRSLRRDIVLRPSRSNSGGYPLVVLSRDGTQTGKYVHRLVLEAFRGPCPPAMETRHLDGVPANCALKNLAYGTSSENKGDQVRHGTHFEASRTHCTNGHEFTEVNSYWNGKQRVCRACNRARVKAWLERSAESGKECAAPGCSNPVRAKGLCRLHYDQERGLP